mmetsp:Transcript_78522/g.138335  ORF Transcript_78522/g.138335 Transcript_78522/m.138335 type:complete len:235 (+) Transcript_78522:39-743(+)
MQEGKVGSLRSYSAMIAVASLALSGSSPACLRTSSFQSAFTGWKALCCIPLQTSFCGRPCYGCEKDGKYDSANNLWRQFHVVCKNELDANEYEDEAKSIVQELEHVNEVLNHEEHGTEAKQGHHSGAHRNPKVGNLSSLCRYAIDGKQEVSGLKAEYERQHERDVRLTFFLHQQRPRLLFTVVLHQAWSTEPAQQVHQSGIHDVFFVITFGAYCLYTTEDQETAKEKMNPRDCF